MLKIQKFQPSVLYSAYKSRSTYELIHRNGHYLIFRAHKPKDRTSYKISATSVFKADLNGAYDISADQMEIITRTIVVRSEKGIPLDLFCVSIIFRD